MERKVGEIFEYNGEWYQCVQGNCEVCDFSRDEHTCLLGVSNCVKCGKNNDCKAVAFKKLEKVGEPHEKRVLDGSFPTFQKYKVYNSVILPKEPYIFCNLIDGTIEIEIKQNKEDMEEKKIQHYDCFFDREPSKSNLKPFDLEAAKAGKPVCTRDGRKARIISFDRKFLFKGISYPIIALVEDTAKEETIYGYNEKGKVMIEDDTPYKDDLMMLPQKKEGWIIIHKEAIYDKETAEKIARETTANVIRIQKIEWEE